MTSMAKKKTEEKFDFGAAYKELEAIIDWFEHGEVDLDAGLEKFERGLALAKKCQERLRDAENKVNAIKLKFDDLDGGKETAEAAD